VKPFFPDPAQVPIETRLFESLIFGQRDVAQSKTQDSFDAQQGKNNRRRENEKAGARALW